MKAQPVIVWLRQDLRIEDQVAFAKAAEHGPVVPVYVLDDSPDWRLGGASRWWLHHSLAELGNAIAAQGGSLILRKGETREQLQHLAAELDACAIYFSRSYEPWARELESEIHAHLGDDLTVKRFSGWLLCEPENLLNQSGKPYRVFTPFWRALQQRMLGLGERQSKSVTNWYDAAAVPSLSLAELELLPVRPDWAQGLRESWQPGASGASQRLDDFLNEAVGSYEADRNRPDVDGTSRLSPHLHFGEIAPLTIWRRVQFEMAAGTIPEDQSWAFLRELGWREFSNHLLYHFPTLPTDNHRPQFDSFPWREDPQGLVAWQQGRTGFPIVDAGMRQLWHTGWMHNRVRMIVGSFLVKDLMIHWRWGEDWFWDTLVDADLASNSASWQWVAGSGADAAPFFRIFNPMTQGEKFDPHGAYIRKWVPEIAALPDKFLNRPWEAPSDVLKQAEIELGQDYPLPIVDHAQARKDALAAFKKL